LNKLTFIK